ncbi:hypothetical protein PF023_10010 [Enterococcus thailandicus]|uniref:hypothetical protein n=1 Tax=Enterococcus thailandicus TaxID=417368 RepID=UPI0022EBBDFE|nr:hypothetical protein [Enterococcus thailandicus]MDA3974382.1 hypothetical protein [Enterococcus thailandicus]MDA3976869.1 hypothetical protein [Enterococcus thailandicus]MDA3981835.1 hypothetical protein [Enterococcus thailandicus]
MENLIEQQVAYREITVPINDNYDGGTIGFWRVGNLVSVGFSFQVKKSLGWIDLGIYPKGFLPQRQPFAATRLSSSSNRGIGAAVYSTDGKMQIIVDANLPNSQSLKGNMTYYTADPFPR